MGRLGAKAGEYFICVMMVVMVVMMVVMAAAALFVMVVMVMIVVVMIVITAAVTLFVVCDGDDRGHGDHDHSRSARRARGLPLQDASAPPPKYSFLHRLQDLFPGNPIPMALTIEASLIMIAHQSDTRFQLPPATGLGYG